MDRACNSVNAGHESCRPGRFLGKDVGTARIFGGLGDVISEVRPAVVIGRWHRRGLVGLLGTLGLMAVAVVVTDPESTVLWALGAILVLTGLALAVPPQRWINHHEPLLMVWPFAAVGALTVFALVQPEAARLIVGIYVLCFLFVGLCQPPGRSLWLLGPAVVSSWTVLDLPAEQAAVRLVLAALIWLIVAEVPARLLSRVFGGQRALTEAAETDTLTGLRNRRGMEEAIAASDRSWCLILCDLDRFKEYNDGNGHVHGDELLAEFSTLLRAEIRRDDSAFRFGGDEFLVLLKDATTAEGRGVAGRLIIGWQSRDPEFSVSVGVARGGPGAVLRADACLYRAKQAGGGTAVVETEQTAPGQRSVPEARFPLTVEREWAGVGPWPRRPS